MTQFLSLPGTSDHFAETPDAASLDITGDVEIIVRVDLDDAGVTVPTLLGKQDGDLAYTLQYVRADKELRYAWKDAAGTTTVIDSTAFATIFDGVHWLRVTHDVDNGASDSVITFYTSTDDTQVEADVTWTQLSAHLHGATTDIGATVDNVALSGRSDGASGNFAGNAYRGIIKNGIDGTTVADFNADDFNVGDSDTDTAVDAQGNVWTINGTGSQIKTDARAALNRRRKYLLRTRGRAR